MKKKYVLVIAVDTEIDHEIYDTYAEAYTRMEDLFTSSIKVDVNDKVKSGEAGIDGEYAWIVDGDNHDNYAFKIIKVEFKEERYIVYIEIHNPNGLVERWYYGTYNHIKANAVAEQLGTYIDEIMETRTYHCVCKEEEAKSMGIQNLPETLDK